MRLKSFASRLILFLLVLSMASCSQFTKMQKSTDNKKKLTYADELYKNKKYNKAQTIYGQIKDYYKGTTEYEQLFYNYAYTYYYMRDYESAAFYFKNFVQIFPNSKYTEEMDYMQAYSFYQLSPRVELDQTNTIKAISALQTFIDIYPNSERSKEGTLLIDELRDKLERKEFKAAQLYYDLGYYQAAGLSFGELLLDYPDSDQAPRYKLLSIKAYYDYADKSVATKQKERFEKVITEYLNFADFYPNDHLLKEAETYYKLAKEHIKTLENESA